MLQDLPEHFEENMEKWMKNFLILLTTDSKQLQVEVSVNFFCYKTIVQWKVSPGIPPLKGYKLLKYENTKKEKKSHWHDLSICSPSLRGKGSLVTFIYLITCEKMKEFCMCSMHFLFTSFWELQPFEPLTLHLPVARMKTAENNRIA